MSLPTEILIPDHRLPRSSDASPSASFLRNDQSTPDQKPDTHHGTQFLYQGVFCAPCGGVDNIHGSRLV